MTSPKQHHEQFTAILAELHEVGQRLHGIAAEVSLQKDIVEVIANGLKDMSAEHIKVSDRTIQSVKRDISDAEERRDNESGNTDEEDRENSRLST